MHFEGRESDEIKEYDSYYNASQLKNLWPSLAPSTHWEFSIRILKLNVKMAPEMSGFFYWLPLWVIYMSQMITWS